MNKFFKIATILLWNGKKTIEIMKAEELKK